MTTNNAPILLMIAPLFGAGICLLEKAFPRISLAKTVSVIALAGSLLLLIPFFPQAEQTRMVYVVGGWHPSVGIQQVFDGMAWLSCAMILTVALLVLLFAFAEAKYDATFYFLHLISVGGMVGVVMAADVFNLFVCLEILGLAAYIQIAYPQKGRALLASFHYLLVSSFGMMFALLGILILYQQTGTLSLFDAGAYCAAHPEAVSPSRIAVGCVALTAGIGVRSAFLPFHAWLPRAHANAPHPVSAMLSGLVLKVSFIAIWRITQAFHQIALRPTWLWIGALTAVFGVVMALAQTDCKVLLAWHSISQIGYIVASFGVGTPLGMTASFLHMINHALFKSLLFLCVGSVIHLTGERDLKRLGGLGRVFPWLTVAFVIGAASIAGVPPFNGFVSKQLMSASLQAVPLASAALWLAGIGTMASFLKLSAIFRPRRAHIETPIRLPNLPYAAYAALLGLSALCVLSGAFGGSCANRAAELLFGSRLTEPLRLYSGSTIFHALMSLLFGIALFFSVTSPRGQAAAARVRAVRVGTNASLVLLIAGFVFFALVTLAV